MKVFIVAGEHSGDQLGYKLMRAMRAQRDDLTFHGVGGEAMQREGLRSLFPLTDIAVMGILPVLGRLPTLVDRINQTVSALVIERPDLLIIIDSPDFTHRVARRARVFLPDLPVVDYVSPSVWAWRPGRARAMRAYVDEVLALLPFEPAAHLRLGGPMCDYVGHPLIERLGELQPRTADEAHAREGSPPTLLVLPGSRRSEIARLSEDFGGAIMRVRAAMGPIEVVLPVADGREMEVRSAIAGWPIHPTLVHGEAEKFAAFRRARAALAASGTVTLELALSGVPMVVAYKVSKLEEQLKYLIDVPSIVLPNLILGENAIPEFLQKECTPEALAGALTPLLRGGPERLTQLSALDRVEKAMLLPDGDTPSARAARLALATRNDKRAAR